MQINWTALNCTKVTSIHKWARYRYRYHQLLSSSLPKRLGKWSLKLSGWGSGGFVSDLWGADFVEWDKDGCVEKTAEGQVWIKGPWCQQQQSELWEESCQSKSLAPAAVCSNTSQTLREAVYWSWTVSIRARIHTFCEVEHVEVWGEVVSDIPSCQMVQVGLMKKLPAIPEETGGVFIQRNKQVYIQWWEQSR